MLAIVVWGCFLGAVWYFWNGGRSDRSKWPEKRQGILCPKCGVDSPNSGNFCVGCGAPVVSRNRKAEPNTLRETDQETKPTSCGPVSGVQDLFPARTEQPGTDLSTQGAHEKCSLPKASAQTSKGATARNLVTRLLLFAVVTIVLVAGAIVFILSRATGGSAGQHSSPPFPVDALVWEKLERASPMYKACTSADSSSLQRRLAASECSVILVQGGQFRLVNWTFPTDLDFSKTGSIAMEDSTEIVRNLDARFGGGFVLDLDTAGQARSDAPDGRAAENQTTVDTLIKQAESGNAEAQATLGSMYDNGQGVVKDDAEAVRWYRKAAEQGHAGAQNNLGLMYLDGLGLTKDEGEAYFWMSLAAPTLGAEAESNRDRVGTNLAADERKEIQERCRKWTRIHPHESVNGTGKVPTQPVATSPVIQGPRSLPPTTNSREQNPNTTLKYQTSAYFDVARMMREGRTHVFVVGHTLDVVDESGMRCTLSEGDALRSISADIDAAVVSLLVSSSKGNSSECAQSDVVTVGVADLQKMQNQMQESIDRGLAELRDKQGKSGRRRTTAGSQ